MIARALDYIAGFLQDCRRSLKKDLRLFVLASIIYLVGIVVGVIRPGGEPGHPDLSAKGLELNQVALFADILGTNIKMELATTLVGGTVGFGVLAALILLFNGFVLGSAIRLSAQYSWVVPLYSVAPHGILEVVAIVLAGFLGMKVPSLVIGYLSGDTDKGRLGESTISLGKISILMALITLVAATVEAFLTPWLLRLAGWW